jgi:hypothetical protein
MKTQLVSKTPLLFAPKPFKELKNKIFTKPPP